MRDMNEGLNEEVKESKMDEWAEKMEQIRKWKKWINKKENQTNE